MSVIFDPPELEIAISQPIYVPVEAVSLEEQIQILKEENARLRETIQFYVELCCLEE